MRFHHQYNRQDKIEILQDHTAQVARSPQRHDGYGTDQGSTALMELEAKMHNKMEKLERDPIHQNSTLSKSNSGRNHLEQQQQYN